MVRFKSKNIDNTDAKGFTLIELLVVIAIIGLLATVVLLSLSRSRESAKQTKVQADLKQLRTAIEELAIDTGKWPNGCPVDSTNNPEVALDTAEAGLGIVPPVGVIDAPCEWTALDVANWRGPYIEVTSLKDPWGMSYYFDPDYHVDPDNLAVLVSWGPTGGFNNYDSDDIYILLR